MNFPKLFEDFNIKYDTKVNKGWANVACPFCSDDHNHLGFNLTGDYAHCWKCGGHNIRQALSKVLSVSLSQIDDIISQYQDKNSLLYRLNGKVKPKAVRLELPTDGFTSSERKYLLSRKFFPRQLHEKYEVVGGGLTGKWKFRIVIPLIIGGKIVSWTARSILSKSQCDELKIPRYKNLSIEESVMNPKDVLFNIDNCLSDKVVLTEGAFDVFRLGDGFLCSFGTSLTQSQIAELGRRYNKIYIMFDNEEEAQKKARKYGLQLSSMGCDVEIVDAYSEFGVNDGAELSQRQVDIIRQELEFS